MVGLGGLPGASNFFSEALDVSAVGSVVVGFSRSGASGSKFEAFRWTQQDGMVGLGALPGGEFVESSALGVSADGSTVVGRASSAGGAEAFRWTAEEGMIGLGDFPGGDVDSTAVAASADGSIVLGIGCSDTFDFTCVAPEAFIWDTFNGMRNLREVLTDDFGLDLTGWLLFSVSASSLSADSRTIVGTAINPDGNPEAWIATLPRPTGELQKLPEPRRRRTAVPEHGCQRGHRAAIRRHPGIGN